VNAQLNNNIPNITITPIKVNIKSKQSVSNKEGGHGLMGNQMDS
jgi:hypothetical protein